MATVKLTIKRGQIGLKDVVVSAGSAEAQTDTMSLNIDFTKLTKGEALILVDSIKQKIHASKWPFL